MTDEERAAIRKRAKELAAAAPPLSESQRAAVARAFADTTPRKPKR